jgi:transcriptional regulator with XRE-family HTH domain
VVNVPGLFGNGKQGRTYFTEKIIDILEEIVKRENTYNFVDFFTDEAGDIWPCQQQLSGDQYNQVAERTPPLLSQLRKQNSFLYCAAHGTQDMHYFVWKIKSNTIAYMNGANVKSFHSEISQSSVNRLDRGSMWVAPKSLEEYALAYEEKDLEWSKDDEHLDLQIKDSLDEKLENEKEEDGQADISVQEVKTSTKKTIAKRLYEDEDLDLTQRDIADRLDISQASVSNALD